MTLCPKCRAELPNEAKFCSNCATPVPRPEKTGLVGKCINNKYIVTQKIAEGGMGEVYLARQQGIEQEVAIKKLHASLCQNQTLVDRFVTEARAYGKISHPNAVKVHDLLNVNGELCIIMEYVKGKTLTHLLDSGYTFSQRQIIDISLQIADALATVHQAGIIHRDLKTENIMLLETIPGRFSVKILDFGIAKVTDAPTDGKTAEGMLLGTPEFMSPEQCCGEKIDLRSDIYSFGVLLYAITSGSLPFSAENKLAILGQQVNMAPAQLRLRDGSLAPAGLDAITMRCLRKKRENRYQNFAEVITDLTALQEGKDPVIAKIEEARQSDASLPPSQDENKPVKSSSSLSEQTEIFEKSSRIELGAVEQMSAYGLDSVKLELNSEPAHSPVTKDSAQKASASKRESSSASSQVQKSPSPKATTEDGEKEMMSGQFELGIHNDDNADVELELSASDDAEPSFGGFSIGGGTTLDDDDEHDKVEKKKSHSGILIVFILLLLGGGGYLGWQHFMQHPASEAPIQAANPPAADEAPIEEAKTEAPAPTPETPELPPVPQRDPIPASQAVTQDILVRGVWRAALDAVPEKLNAGDLDTALKKLDEIEKNKTTFTDADNARLASLREQHSLFKQSLESAAKAQKSLACDNIKSILANLPPEATGVRVKIEKLQRSCSSTFQRPPTSLDD